MVPWLLYILTRRLLTLVALRFRSGRSKDLAIVVLRHELGILRRQVARPELSDAGRIFLAAASRLLPRRRWASFVVRPETCCAGTAAAWPGAGRTPGGGGVGRRSILPSRP